MHKNQDIQRIPYLHHTPHNSILCSSRKAFMIFYKLFATGLLASLLDSNIGPHAVKAHGYLKTPRSRNYYASTNGVWFGGGASDPLPETCPHCLNIGGTEGRCGVIGERSYDYPPNGVGGVMPPIIQACYEPGSIIDIETILTAHHMGHFTYKACPINPGEVPSQECFDENPLTFISDEVYAANPDPTFPARAYIPPRGFHGGLVQNGGDYFHYKYKLPEGLIGDLVLIQWHYISGNSCEDVGYDDYDWPEGFYVDVNLPKCQSIPPDGRGVPEQFWNCAEVRISNDCDGTVPPFPPPKPTTPNPTSPTTAPPNGTPISPTPTPFPPSPSPPTPDYCAADTNQCGPGKPCNAGLCCSQWGYCGTSDGHCGECCQSNCNAQGPTPPSPVPPTPTPPSPTPPSPSDSYTADHGEDSRLIAYVGNWQSCPTDEQVDNYSHLVTYTWNEAQNQCDQECKISGPVPICDNANKQGLVDKWRSKGKKVILSFGGAGMGGSWNGDRNNCWDYCFGKEEELSSSLVDIIDKQHFDGIDIDYEYCYDVEGFQSGRCSQRTNHYSDIKAQTFLDSLTSKLRMKLDVLKESNGYSRGRYEITHAPMDIDVSTPTSKYFQILKKRKKDLDFLMPQLYNGVTRPGADGFAGSGIGAMKASDLFTEISNNMFEGEPNKVVFGFCINDCSGTGSNVNGNQAAKVMSDVKKFNGGEFVCNGGAFFWVALDDYNGAWSQILLNEVSQTAGCSLGVEQSTSSSSSTSSTSSSITTDTTAATTTSTATSSSGDGSEDLVINEENRCGPSELHARETCGTTCQSDSDCPRGEYCWAVFPNYCGSIPKRHYANPTQSTVWSRCGASEIDARTFCGESCDWPDRECSVGICQSVHSNYCGSTYTEEEAELAFASVE